MRYLSSISLALIVLMALACSSEPATPSPSPTPTPSPSPTPAPNLTKVEVTGLVTSHLQNKSYPGISLSLTRTTTNSDSGYSLPDTCPRCTIKLPSSSAPSVSSSATQFGSSARICWNRFAEDSFSSEYDRTSMVWTVTATTDSGDIRGQWSVYDRTMAVVAGEDNYKGC